jgi:2-dehydropantoate 2-reductase
LRILIMGSGGVGGVFGARLAKAGADVTFVARGAHLNAMRKNGLRIEGGADPVALPKVNATDDPAEAGRVDMILFAVKLWDTESAARSLLPCIGADTGLISFQNGVQKDDMLRPIVGDQALAWRHQLCLGRHQGAGRDRADRRSMQGLAIRRVRRPAQQARRGFPSPPVSPAASTPKISPGHQSGDLARSSSSWRRSRAQRRRCAHRSARSGTIR